MPNQAKQAEVRLSTPTSWRKALRAATRPDKAPAVQPTPTPDDGRAAPGGMDGSQPSAPLRQAFRDLKRGVQDTDRGPEADSAYKKLKR